MWNRRGGRAWRGHYGGIGGTRQIFVWVGVGVLGGNGWTGFSGIRFVCSAARAVWRPHERGRPRTYPWSKGRHADEV